MSHALESQKARLQIINHIRLFGKIKISDWIIGIRVLYAAYAPRQHWQYHFFPFVEARDEMCDALPSQWPRLTDVNRTAMHLAKLSFKSKQKFFRVGQGHES